MKSSALLINWMSTCNLVGFLCTVLLGGLLCNCSVVYLIESWVCLSSSYSGAVLPFLLFLHWDIFSFSGEKSFSTPPLSDTLHSC